MNFLGVMCVVKNLNLEIFIKCLRLLGTKVGEYFRVPYTTFLARLKFECLSLFGHFGRVNV